MTFDAASDELEFMQNLLRGSAFCPMDDVSPSPPAQRISDTLPMNLLVPSIPALLWIVGTYLNELYGTKMVATH